MVVALIGALMIGLTMGLLGSGGSILSVPILIYLIGQEEKVAIAGSLIIVALISMVAAIPFALKKQIHWRSVVVFGVPGMLGAFVGAYAARYVEANVQMLVFSVLLLSAAYLMYRPIDLNAAPKHPRAVWKIALDGWVVGAVTGLVGVGGGFLIIPALVLLGGLSMSLAIGTSLVIILLKSAVGFVEYLRVLQELNLSLDWTVIALFSLVGILGGLLGGRLGQKLPQQILRRGFAGFLVLMGSYILYMNLGLLF
jgi:uncharacterized membrane protein YfcA